MLVSDFFTQVKTLVLIILSADFKKDKIIITISIFIETINQYNVTNLEDYT